MRRLYPKASRFTQLYVGERAIAHVKGMPDGKFRVRTSLNQSREVTEQHYFSLSMALVEAVDFMLAAERDEGLSKITQHSRLATA